MAVLLFRNFVICLLILFTVGSESKKCGYSSCHPIKEGYTNVHMISHTHDDVGWLKTMDQYYWGKHWLNDQETEFAFPQGYYCASNFSRVNHIRGDEYDTAQAGVQYIIDSVVKSLQYDPTKRFIYVETAFFWEWWKKQSKKVHRLVRKLVREGRLEFIGGAWSMHDEATTHYQSIIDEFTWGFRRLSDEFGDCGTPRIGWQIDPFGHARETASIMARLGFDALFVGRVDYRDQNQRELTKSMEMIWESSPNLGNETDLFLGVLYNTYEAPTGFCFDLFCGYPPVVDDVTSPEYNADSMAETFISEIMNRTKVYKGSNIAMAMGGDFNYQPANVYFTSTDRLIKAVNARQVTHGSKINLLYSTPSCYAKALNDEGQVWPTKQDDFFPYASTADAYWSGYYTSRPAVKRYERMGNNFLQICKQLSALSDLKPEDQTSLDILREAMGVLQHHDAIAGTEKQAVAFDYARRLSKGFDKCAGLTETALNKLMAASSASDSVVVESCNLLNISQCQVSESQSSFVVTLYNPLSRTVSRYVRLPVSGDGTSYTIYNNQGDMVAVQVVAIPDAVLDIPGRTSAAKVELVFQASDLPPLGFRSYFVTSSGSANSRAADAGFGNNTEITIGFPDSLQLTIDETSGLPSKLTIPGVSESSSFQQNFFFYSSYAGNNEIYQNQSSGAYVFRPNSSLVGISSQATIKIYKGDLVEEVHQQFSSWVSQVIRAYKGEDHLEFNWLIGPVPISDGVGKEVVTQYDVEGMDTNSTFYTDSNGREMIERVLNYRPTYNLTLEEPIAGNYFPVNTRISIKDTTKQVSVVTDRSHGASSLEDGEIELMLHRRLLYDDDMGVLEALNETAFGEGLVVRGTHYLSAGSVSNQSAVDRRLVQRRVLDTWTFFTPTSLSLSQWQASYNMEYTALKADLPKNVQILTLEPWKGTHFLLRLEHILEENDDDSASTAVTVNLNDIFDPFTILSVSEKTLGANRGLEEVTRLVWKKENNKETPSKTIPQDLPYIVLTPMAIKTFVIKVSF